MLTASKIRKAAIISEYSTLFFKRAEKWIRNHDPSEVEPPDWFYPHDMEPTRIFDPDARGDVLVNCETAAFLAGLALTRSSVECDYDTLVTTANFVVIRGQLASIGLDNLDNVVISVDDVNSPPVIGLHGSEDSVYAPVTLWSDSMYDPWDGTWAMSDTNSGKLAVSF